MTTSFETFQEFEIEIPIQLAFTGGQQMIEVNGKQYLVKIKEGCQNGEFVDVGNNILVQVVYQQNQYFSRNGDDLICLMVLEERYRNEYVNLPYIINNIQIDPVYLSQEQFIYNNMGFYNQQTGRRGRYIFKVEFIDQDDI